MLKYSFSIYLLGVIIRFFINLNVVSSAEAHCGKRIYSAKSKSRKIKRIITNIRNEFSFHFKLPFIHLP